MRIKNFLIIILAIIIVLLNSCAVFAESKSNYNIVKEYCREHYPNCKVVFLKKYNAKKIEHRKNKNIVYVEKSISISSGEKDKCNGMYWGYIKGQHYYRNWYNKKVKKGKKVISYFIYNPYTNYEDDIVAVVDNHMIR